MEDEVFRFFFFDVMKRNVKNFLFLLKKELILKEGIVQDYISCEGGICTFLCEICKLAQYFS